MSTITETSNTQAMDTHRYVLRATIEFTTPFLVGAGRGGDIADAVFVADVNGLPTIPGTSIAGVLRSAALNAGYNTDEIFGYQDGDGGEGSRLRVSWACIHDRHNKPVEGIANIADDQVLAKALNPAIRDHVRINAKGASDAKEHGKFDEQAVCAGHRFTFELELLGNGQHRPQWVALLNILGDPALRLGGKTRRGFGAFKVVSLLERSFDLRAEFDGYIAHPVSLAEESLQLVRMAPAPVAETSALTITLALHPTGYWMFGGGYDLETAAGDADMAPVRDCRIEWKDNAGSVKEDLLLIPASGLKGALAHRVAFHYNALSGIFADTCESEIADITGENNAAVGELFGYCKDDKAEDGSQSGQRGRVIFDDVYLEMEHLSQLVHHVGIDRFTGGARDQVLFNERLLWQQVGDIPVTISITDSHQLSEKAKTAFAMALDDLLHERLQVGAGHGRGLGYFTGTICWPAGNDWSL